VVDCTVLEREKKISDQLVGGYTDEGRYIYGWRETIVKGFHFSEFMSFCVYFCLENLFCWHHWHHGVARQVP
jgi:hypothetical protein